MCIRNAQAPHLPVSPLLGAVIWGLCAGLASPLAGEDGLGARDGDAVVRGLDDGVLLGVQTAADLMTLARGHLQLGAQAADLLGVRPEQVVEIITDPEDAATPWLYKRTYTAKRITQNALGTTSTVTESRTVTGDVVRVQHNAGQTLLVQEGDVIRTQGFAEARVVKVYYSGITLEVDRETIDVPFQN